MNFLSLLFALLLRSCGQFSVYFTDVEAFASRGLEVHGRRNIYLFAFFGLFTVWKRRSCRNRIGSYCWSRQILKSLSLLNKMKNKVTSFLPPRLRGRNSIRFVRNSWWNSFARLFSPKSKSNC